MISDTTDEAALRRAEREADLAYRRALVEQKLANVEDMRRHRERMRQIDEDRRRSDEWWKEWHAWERKWGWTVPLGWIALALVMGLTSTALSVAILRAAGG